MRVIGLQEKSGELMVAEAYEDSWCLSSFTTAHGFNLLNPSHFTLPPVSPITNFKFQSQLGEKTRWKVRIFFL